MFPGTTSTLQSDLCRQEPRDRAERWGSAPWPQAVASVRKTSEVSAVREAMRQPVTEVSTNSNSCDFKTNENLIKILKS